MGKISSAVSHSVDTESVPHSNVVVVKKPRNGGGNFVTDGGSRNGSQRPEKLALQSDSESDFSSHGARGKSSSNFPPDFSDQGQGDDKSEDNIEKMSGSDGETEKRLEKTHVYHETVATNTVILHMTRDAESSLVVALIGLVRNISMHHALSFYQIRSLDL